MSDPRLGGVSRRRVLRALRAESIEMRPRGGEIVIVFPGRHFRLGARKGVGPALLSRLLNELAATGVAAEKVSQRLHGKDARRRNRDHGSRDAAALSGDATRKR